MFYPSPTKITEEKRGVAVGNYVGDEKGKRFRKTQNQQCFLSSTHKKKTVTRKRSIRDVLRSLRIMFYDLIITTVKSFEILPLTPIPLETGVGSSLHYVHYNWYL